MAWEPSETLLGTHAEMVSFSHSVSYFEETAGDPEAIPPTEGTTTYYDVKITPQEANPSTVAITAGDPATISGYYKGIFNDVLVTRDKAGNFTTVTTLTGGDGGVFDKVDRDKLHEVISFQADTTRSKTFTYLAEAYDPQEPEVIVASQEYTVLARDLNWTTGMNNLKELVSYASSKPKG
jgi:hypothetical protein